MCGIAGYITRDGKAPAVGVKQLKAFFVATQERGTDASGVFWEEQNEHMLMKAPNPAQELATFIPWKEVKKSPVCLLHARLATQGPVENNQNNHPLFDDPWVLVHNGIISNSDRFVARNLTDSYAILEAIQNTKDQKTLAMKVKKAMTKLEGSLACGLYNLDEKRLFLLRHGNPLSVGFKRNTLFFASTPKMLRKVNPQMILNVPFNSMISIKEAYHKSYKIKCIEKGGDTLDRWFDEWKETNQGYVHESVGEW